MDDFGAKTRRTPAWLRPAAIVAGIYVCPVMLLESGVIPFQLRFHVLLLMTLVAAALSFTRHSAVNLGLTLPRLGPLAAWSVVPAALLMGLVLLRDSGHRVATPGHTVFYLFFVFVSAPAQEFVYRSFLFAEMRAARIPQSAIVFLSAGLFGFMHIIYRDFATVLLTLAAGLIWAVLFHSTRKTLIVALSHAAVGMAAIFSGIV